jgi:hypothetical protein
VVPIAEFPTGPCLAMRSAAHKVPHRATSLALISDSAGNFGALTFRGPGVSSRI